MKFEKLNVSARSCILAALAITSTSIRAAESPGHGVPLHDAREMAPSGLIGFWKADLAASTYPGAKPVVALRSFAYDADGRVLVSFASRSTDGAITSGHWAAQVDGTPGVEYHSGTGSTAFNVVSWKVIGDGRLALTVSRGGKVNIQAVYQLSDDKQVLTYSYGKTIIVYRRWNLED
ncbi:hypothetical protein [Hephaestia mangrovi]|uniref:hypothetical protein n=1 Tax=Hephaestia mangrovi TaxID=2873268 RepID=UPI001CA69CF5|nr:hypothetical protein [Hephaestia mangrovi]MBY8828918.1 hypothetical protein [Hephaestia mangrovi]